MNKDSTKQTPNEIPVRENPDKTYPTKDPLTPNDHNPINPQTDE